MHRGLSPRLPSTPALPCRTVAEKLKLWPRASCSSQPPPPAASPTEPTAALRRAVGRLHAD
eukprot:SAG11_NODE_28315_length_323_cov_0.687500_1_plen_60_part_10